MNETVFFFFLECTFLHRILRIPLKSAASLHRSTGWVWPGQPAPWFCIKPAVKADDMQDRTQEEHTGELHFDLREYNFFMDFSEHIFLGSLTPCAPSHRRHLAGFFPLSLS